jgi:ornithine carbamoyltransferase
MTRHFRSLLDLSRDELIALLDRSSELRRVRGTNAHPRPLAGKSIAVIFDKASTRTRISFEVGIAELGGHPLIILSKDTQMGRGEPIEDTARMLSRYCHAAVYRTFGQERVDALAAAATIPVVNALTDEHHPCQLLADLLAVRDAHGADWSRVTVAWIGDGNNMANSWIHAAGILGFSLRLACPEGYDPSERALAEARALSDAEIRVVRDPSEAARGAHVVTTDVWASMGQETEATDRQRAFAHFQVDEAVMGVAHESSIFLHCLPAHRGEEVAASVIDGPRSRVWDEAENRLHTQKALLEWLVAGAPRPAPAT